MATPLRRHLRPEGKSKENLEQHYGLAFDHSQTPDRKTQEAGTNSSASDIEIRLCMLGRRRL